MVEWEYAVLTLEFPELPTLGGKGARRQREIGIGETKRKRVRDESEREKEDVCQISENESTTLSHTPHTHVQGGYSYQVTFRIHGISMDSQRPSHAAR